MARSRSYNKLLVPGASAAIQQYKEEIASEFGVKLGESTTARANGLRRRRDYQTPGASGTTNAIRSTQPIMVQCLERCGFIL